MILMALRTLGLEVIIQQGGAGCTVRHPRTWLNGLPMTEGFPGRGDDIGHGRTIQQARRGQREFAVALIDCIHHAIAGGAARWNTASNSGRHASLQNWLLSTCTPDAVT